MTQIGVAILTSIEKALIHDKDRNFDPIDTKLITNVGFIYIQIDFVNVKPIGAAILSSKKSL